MHTVTLSKELKPLAGFMIQFYFTQNRMTVYGINYTNRMKKNILNEHFDQLIKRVAPIKPLL
jgi:hypothetical protein